MDFDLGESSKFKVGRIRIPFYKYWIIWMWAMPITGLRRPNPCTA